MISNLASNSIACQVESKPASGNSTSPIDSPFQISEQQDGLTIEFDGRLFARYVVTAANKPYLWPIIGPTGKPMTRAFPMEQVDAEPESYRDHPHHRGLMYGHESCGLAGWRFPKSAQDWEQIMGKERTRIGGDSWHEPATYASRLKTPNKARGGKRRTEMLATIKHREFKELKVRADRAVVLQICDHLNSAGKRFMTEHRRLVFRAADSSRSIDFDQTFLASDGDVVFEDRKDAGLGIRVPLTMAAESKQGGAAVNSDGLPLDEAWGKPAKWCDYHGPVGSEHLGIAFLNHPTSYRFPTRWHVRNYGLFASNPFGLKSFDRKLNDGTTTLKRGEKLELRHRLIFHKGDASAASIEEAWKTYAKENVSHEQE